MIANSRATRRITIRMTPNEYAAIDQYCAEHNLSYSRLFMEAIRPSVQLPPRVYYFTGEEVRAKFATFYETINERYPL